MVTSATLTTSTSTEFIPTVWSDDTIEAVEFAAVIAKRVNRKWESQLRVGNTLNIPYISNLTTQNKSSGISNTVNFEAITEAKETITVSTHQYVAFLIENVLEVQANTDLRQKYTNKIGYALARGIEVALSALFASLSQTVGTLNQELTTEDFLEIVTYFATAGLLEDDMDAGDEYSLILSPKAYVNLLKVEEFINRQYNTAGDAIQRARVGDVYGLPIYRSNLLTVNSSGHDCAAFKRDCYGLIVQKTVPVRSQFKIDNIADGVIGWNLYGHSEILHPPETPGGGAATDSHGVWVKTV